jgi:integrase
MPNWEQTGRLAIERLSHPLCRAYVEFLLYTGIRHGTEAMPLRWKHIQWHWIGDQRYLRIWVSGKTGPRYLIAKNAVNETLERLISWQELEQKTLEAAIESKLDRIVFCFPSGDTPYRMEGVFRKLMRDSGLAKDEAGKTRTLYSLRHTYATFALTDGVDIHTLARQMGTSVSMLEKHYSKITPMMNAAMLADSTKHGQP